MDIIVHAGSLKTGSSYLQKTLWNNIPTFHESGVLLPTTGVVAEHHYDIARALGFGYQANALPPQRAGEITEQLVAELRESGSPAAIISSEHFDIGVNHESTCRLAQALSGHNVTVLIYLRNQVDLAQSLYFERIKWGGTSHFSEFINRTLRSRFFFYDERIEAWLNSGVRVIVKDYDQERANLLGGFLSMLPASVSAQTLEVPSDLVNVSLSPEAMEYLRAQNNNEADPTKRRELYVQLYEKLHQGQSRWVQGRRIALPHNLIEVLPELSRRNQRIANLLNLALPFLKGNLSEYYLSSLPPGRELDMSQFENELRAGTI